MSNLKSARPIRKVTAGSLAGAVIVLVTWILDTAWHVKVPSEVTAAITTLVTFGTSYLTPSAPDDLVAPDRADGEYPSMAA